MSVLTVEKVAETRRAMIRMKAANEKELAILERENFKHLFPRFDGSSSWTGYRWNMNGFKTTLYGANIVCGKSMFPYRPDGRVFFAVGPTAWWHDVCSEVSHKLREYAVANGIKLKFWIVTA